MKVMLSGRADLAALRDGGAWLCITSEEPERAVPLSEWKLRELLTEFDDVETFECTNIVEVGRLLDAAWRRQSALPLALIAIDGETCDDERIEAVTILNELLCDVNIGNAVRDRLYSAPLPAKISIGKLRSAIKVSSAASVKKLLDDIIYFQDAIRTRRYAWDTLARVNVGNSNGS